MIHQADLAVNVGLHWFLAMLTPLIRTFADILQQRTYANIRISVHYTQAGNAQAAMKALSRNPLPDDLALYAGRPNLGQTLASVVDEARSLSVFKNDYRTSDLGGTSAGPCGVIVGVCGPMGLTENVRKVVGDLDPSRRAAVGGVEIHSE